MTVIQLPAQLPGVLNLSAVNQQLRVHAVQLDWSAVVNPEGPQLAQLLAGLDLSDHSDSLGLDTILSDKLGNAVMAYFDQAEEPPRPPQKKVAANSLLSPEVWQQQGLFGSDPLQLPLSETASETVSKTDKVTDLDFYEAAPAAEIPDRTLQSFTPYQIRQELEARVVKDLLGPAEGPQEEIDDGRVSDRYLVGLLAPKKRDRQTQIDTLLELQEPLEIAGVETVEDGSSEQATVASKTIFPSSLGMTFCVSNEAEALHIVAGWGQYERTKSEYQETETGNPKTVWKRYPIRKQSPSIPLREGTLADWRIHEDFAVFVKGKIRRQQDCWIISLFLVNDRTEPEKQSDSAWLFQPELLVKSATDRADIFLKRPQRRPTDFKRDPVYYGEEQMMNMLYRQQVEFAVGHGVGVHASVLPTDSMRATELAISVVPAYEVPKSTPPTAAEEPALKGLVLKMNVLAGLMPDALPDKLAALPLAYEQWIQGQRDRLTDPDEGLEDYQSSAHEALEKCDRALARIRAGIETLRTNPQAARAFLVHEPGHALAASALYLRQ